MTPSRWGRAIATASLLWLVASLTPAVASAHPLGNFSINHYNGLMVTPGSVVVDHVLDLSEIPTFSERAAMDLDGDGDVADDEARAWASASCASAAEGLRLTQDGARLRGSVAGSSVAFAPGQGALTLRLECRIDWPLAAHLSTTDATSFDFRDDTFSERIGWREIVVVGDGVSITTSDAPSGSTSDRLRSYPPDPLAAPATQSAATFTAQAGLVTAGAPAPLPVAAAAAVPTAPDGLSGEIAALLEADEIDVIALLVALAFAVGLGALHALSPGHGKTVMAAYLVGARGTVRTAIGLGLVVTIAHTAGVLVLGLVTLGASSLVPVERLYPILGLVSGVIVLAIGSWLLWSRLVVGRGSAHAHVELTQEHGHDHTHGHDDAHGHAHPHPHAPENGHEHGHRHADGHGHAEDEHPHGPETDGWHGHGPFRHRHELPARGSGWRGLASLGLAGGMIPSASALILLLGAVSVGRPELGIVLTLAFGFGMALVLVGVGVAVIVGRGAVMRLGGSRVPTRLVAAVPAAAGALVIAIGVVMTVQALVTLELVGPV